MITIKNIKTLDGQKTELSLPSSSGQVIDAEGRLTLFPATVDPHISLGSPQGDRWKFSIESAIRGGSATLLDIPTKKSPTNSTEEIDKKKADVDGRLEKMKMPLHYFPYIKGNSDHVEKHGVERQSTFGSVLLFEQGAPPLEDQIWDRAFQAAAWKDLPVIVNVDHENRWENGRLHSSGERLLDVAIHYAQKQNSRLYVFNISGQEDLKVIEEGRKKEVLIYGETTPRHLSLANDADADSLWDALNRGRIDTLGSGFLAEKEEPGQFTWHGEAFSLSNPIFSLPLLLTAYREKRISLEKIVRLTRVNFYDIMNLERKDRDFILIDLEKEESVEQKHEGQSKTLRLKGWPLYSVIKDQLFELSSGGLINRLQM